MHELAMITKTSVSQHGLQWFFSQSFLRWDGLFVVALRLIIRFIELIMNVVAMLRAPKSIPSPHRSIVSRIGLQPRTKLCFLIFTSALHDPSNFLAVVGSMNES